MWDLIKDAVDGWQRDNASMLAAAVAFYTIFSLAPMLVIALAVAGAVIGEGAARTELAGQLDALMGPRAATFILLVLDGIRSDGGIGVTLMGPQLLSWEPPPRSTRSGPGSTPFGRRRPRKPPGSKESKT